MVKVGPIQAYADGLLNDHELAKSADTSKGLPVHEKNAGRSHSSASHVPHEVSPPRINPAGLVAARPDGRSKLLSGDTSGPTSITTLAQPAPSKKPTTTISKEELEVRGYCSRRSNQRV